MNFFKLLFKPRNPEPDPDEEDAIEDERELGSVNKGLARQNRIINWLGAIGACALAAFLLYKYYAGVYEDRQQSKLASKDSTRTVVTTSLPPLTMPDPSIEQAPALAGLADGPPPPMRAPDSPTVAPPESGRPAAKSPSQLARERRLKREVRFSFDGSLASSATTVGMGSHAAIVSSGETAGQERGSPAPGETDHGKMAKTGMEMARAYLLPDPTLMMTRGKLIRCTVMPAFDTTLTGPVTCVTGEDATGADNKVSLMDRGTICFGQQGGGITHGQRRIGIIWQRCETPQHALVPFNSGATDPLGRPGIPGTVDNHFWDRFGGAIALSLITDVGPYLIATRQRGDNNTTVSFPSMSGPKDVLSEVVKSTVDIAPTITGPQGAEVFIYLAHDIDFRDIYRLERAR